MKDTILADIVLMAVLIFLIALCFNAVIVNFKKEKYFSAGNYFAGLITFCTLMIKFIIIK